MTEKTVKLTPAQALNRARQLYLAGKFPRAAQLCHAILKERPRDPDTLNLAAATQLSLGKTEDAVALMKRAVAVVPKNAAFLANLAEMQRRAGDTDAALETAKASVAADPNVPLAQANLGIALYEAGDLDGAKAAHHAALALDPNLPRSVNNLASIARDEEDQEAAIAGYRRALRMAPADDEIAANLGTVLLDNEREKETLNLLVPYAQSKPQVSAEIHAVTGRAHMRVEDYDESERSFRTALKVDTKHIGAHLGLCQVLQQKNHPDKAAAVAAAALKIDPDSAAANHQLGLCVVELGKPERAKELYETALDKDPEFHPALMSLAYLAMEMGNTEEARGYFETAIAKEPDNFGGHLGLVRLEKVKEDSVAMQALEEAAKDLDDLHPKRRIALHYALGKGYEDLKNYDAAWHNYANGAALKRAEIDYDITKFEDRVDHIIEVMTPDRIAQLRKGAITSATPIFVLGMPRSGTTLTETILASHPKVFGAGELSDMGRLLPTDLGDPNLRYPHRLTHAAPDGLRKTAENYLAGLQRRAPDTPFITDKMPANFMYLGLIHALMPNATIVHTVRDGMDVCVSCFTRLFDRSQLQSYDQVEIARYHNGYKRLMAHWREVLPNDAFLDFEYEGLVADFEPQARRLIDWAGLEWDDACLEFHQTKRSVRTASVTQVRQPVYKTSVRKWERYKDHLGPMMEALDEVG